MKYIIIFLSIFLLSGCKEKVYVVEDTTDIVIDNSDLEVYSDIYLNDILEISNDNIKIISDNYKLDTEELGNKTYEIMYKLNNKTYLYKYNLNVVDTELPIVFSGTNRTVKVGYTGDLCNLITYGDNYTGDLKCEINGDYDLNKVGTYNLIYSIIDSSDNKKDVNVTLNVVDKTNSSSYYNPVKIPFIDIYNKYKSDNTEIGIDVSEWQGEIDFNKVKEAGASFVMIRIGFQNKDGLPNDDRTFNYNIKKAKEAGLKVGVYLYSIAEKEDEAVTQAKWVIEKLDGESLDLPIVFDWENWQYWNLYKISFHKINEIANSFIKTINENGYTGMLYSSKFYLETIWKNKNDYPVWLAHYIDKTDYKGKYEIWQLCNNAKIDGINGDVDVNVMYKK